MNELKAMNFERSLIELNPALRAWGEFVLERVKEYVEMEIGTERIKSFFKLEPNSRTKSITSSLNKQSKKKYDDPLDQMSDLVGARFVVLLKTDITFVERAVLTCTSWSISKDRNPEDEIEEDPNSFDYQSVHFVVRNNQQFERGGILIIDGLACEIQIRTLLQHAYAELVHDKFYKSQNNIPWSARRLVARSMALMETTDEMFVSAVSELDRVNQNIKDWCFLLDSSVGSLLSNFIPTAEDPDAIELLSTFKFLLDAANTEDVKSLLALFQERILNRSKAPNLFSKPVVLIVYWLAKNQPLQLDAIWPNESLAPDRDLVKSDLGTA
jgi:putative GTP pyrophosphokinase